jgi:hypothetical protein
MKRFLVISALLIAGFLGGFELEHWKVAVNYILEHQNRVQDWDSMAPDDRASNMQATKLNLQYDYYYEHAPIRFLFQLHLSELARMKWLLTGLGMLFFFVMSAAVLKMLFPNSSMLKWLAFGYGATTALAILIFVLFHLMGKSAEGYAITRKLLGGLQSFVPMMLYVPAAILIRQPKNLNNHENDLSEG